MEKLQIGDIVRFKDEKLKKERFTVYHINRKYDEVFLEEVGDEYYFKEDCLEVVQKCPYKFGDKVSLKAIYWNEDNEYFVVNDAIGIVDDEGYIKFKERTMDCYGVPVTKIGKMYEVDEHGNDYDVVFCLPDEEHIVKAKQTWATTLDKRISDLEKTLSELKTNKAALMRCI